MKHKRPPTLKQLFNAWLKSQKKDAEAYKLKCDTNKLAREIDGFTTELIEHEEKIYRITVNKNGYGYGNGYKIEVVATAAEFPVKN